MPSQALGTACTYNTLTVAGATENVSYTVAGSEALSLTAAAATKTRDAINASGFTGALTLTDSGQGDLISTGSGATTIVETDTAASTTGNTITLLAGHTAVDTLAIKEYAVAATAPTIVDTVKNFALGQDIIASTSAATNYANAATGAAASSSTLLVGQQGDLGASVTINNKGIVAANSFTTSAQFIAAAEASTAAVAHHMVAWYDGVNTWVAEFGATQTEHENLSFHLRSRFASLGRTADFAAFWLACLQLMPLCEAMAWLDHDGVAVP